MITGRKIYIVGASGLLGGFLRRKLSQGNDITAFSKTGRDQTIACDFSLENSLTPFFESKKPDLVINAAAYSNVDGCERDPGLAHGANALAVKHLAANCGRHGAPLVHVSTDYVFDGRKNSPYVESDATAPVNIYGLTKLEGEYYAARCQAPSAIVRTSWIFGAGGSANFVSAVLERLKKEDTIGALDDQTDAPTYAGDLVDAIQNIGNRLLSARPSSSEIYHVCNSGAATRLEMTHQMKAILDLKKVQVFRADPASIQGRVAVRPAYAVMSNRHYETTFGVKLRPWQESLAEYLKEAASCAS